MQNQTQGLEFRKCKIKGYGLGMQNQGLGFQNVYLYMGGMFEWLLLQDIYGIDEFPTTNKFLDILYYKPNAIL